MLRSLYSGVSGMRCNQTKMDVIGNNISNVNTTGFKAGRVRFQDLFSQTMSSGQGPTSDTGGTNPKQVGLGVSLAAIDTLMTGGTLQPTGRDLDLAIEGEGFFTVSSDGGETKLFTRDGALFTDYQGNLVTANGMSVLGYQPFNIASNQYQVSVDTIQNFNQNISSVDGTTETQGQYNFDITAEFSSGETITIAGTTLTAGTDFAITGDAAAEAAAIIGAYNTATGSGAYSATSSGATITLTEPTAAVTGTDLASADISVNATNGAVSNLTVNQSSITNGTHGEYAFDLSANIEPGRTMTIGTVTLTEGTDFNAGVDTNTTAVNIVNAYNLVARPVRTHNATVTGSTITLTEIVPTGTNLVAGDITSTNPNYGTILATTTPDNATTGINNPTSTSDTRKLTTLKIPKMINSNNLESYAIDGTGLVTGVYGGVTYYLGRVAVSKFSNPEGLEKVGNNCYVKSNNSGDIQVGQGGLNGFGKIKSGTIEMSNVDLANEFTEMIITSRAYSANSRTITTSDEMLQELLNLKR